jgi:hypothetical protein
VPIDPDPDPDPDSDSDFDSDFDARACRPAAPWSSLPLPEAMHAAIVPL